MAGWDIGDFGRLIACDGACRVLVVRAARGIGRATAEYLATCGATAMLADRDGDGAEAVAQGIRTPLIAALPK